MNDIPDGQPCVCSQHLDVSRLEAEVERLRNPWQPIETAPKDGTRIQAWNGEEQFVCSWEVCYSESSPDDWRWESAPDCLPVDKQDWPTHWMPLPEPPEES